MTTDENAISRDVAIIRLMREASGMGMMDCKNAFEDARDNLDGDLVVALLVRDAHGLAVNVRSRDPQGDHVAARRRWDIGQATGGRAAAVARGGAWAELDRLSTRSQNGSGNL